MKPESHPKNRRTRDIRIFIAMTVALVLLPGFATLLQAQADNGATPPEIVDNDHSPYHVALLNYKSGHYDVARTAIDAAEKAKPGDLPTEILKSRILTEQGDFAEGEKLLRGVLTPNGPLEVELALGDLLLRKRDFNEASKYYELALTAKPNDPDIKLKIIYAKIGASDLVMAEKYASQLKPLDPDHPSYYFAKAALAQATGKGTSEEDIETVRTIYGITVTNHYLKTYLELFSAPEKNPAGTSTPSSPATNAAPAIPKP